MIEIRELPGSVKTPEHLDLPSFHAGHACGRLNVIYLIDSAMRKGWIWEDVMKAFFPDLKRDFDEIGKSPLNEENRS